MLTEEQVAKWQSLCDSAAKGPWQVECGGGVHMDSTCDWYAVSCPWNTRTRYHIGLAAMQLPEAEFVAAARTALPALLTDRAELVVEVERLKKALNDCIEIFIVFDTDTERVIAIEHIVNTALKGEE